MYKGFGFFADKGRHYHVAQCKKCSASVQATERQRLTKTPENSWLKHLNTIIPCCENPDYSFLWL